MFLSLSLPETPCASLGHSVSVGLFWSLSITPSLLISRDLSCLISLSLSVTPVLIGRTGPKAPVNATATDY